MKNKRWLLARRPEGSLSAGDLALEESAIPAITDGQLLVRNLYLSLDPTNRLWMSDREQYLPPVQIGDVMRGLTIGVVEASKADGFAVGDIVQPAAGGWQTHVVAEAATTRRIDNEADIPLTAHLSVLGATGLTAYAGLTEICYPQAGESVVISAAAGAVGSIAGQLARVRGCRVVGIAGGAAKCGWLTDELGFDGAIDYKSQDVGESLDRLLPDGIDIVFENVGGSIMEASFIRLRNQGRMAVCGLIASYNEAGPIPGPRDFGRILMRRLTVRGFIVIDYLRLARAADSELRSLIRDGRLKWKDHVVEGIREAPAALERLFTGNHNGKLMVDLTA